MTGPHDSVIGVETELAEAIVDAATDPGMLELAQAQGAVDINVAGICCTANEVLMRRGVPIAGSHHVRSPHSSSTA